MCRKVARRVVVDGAEYFEEITSERVTQHLGVPRFRATMTEEASEIGLATGLAWTEVGGEILVTEATLMPGKGKLTLTGKLGDVMQESAQAAMSFVRSRVDAYGLPRRLLQDDGRARARARGRHPEGRPVGRHHDGDGDDLGAGEGRRCGATWR